MLRIWQRLLHNWAFYNPFSKVTFLCPIQIENRTPLKKFLGCLNVGLILTVLKKLLLRIWQWLLHKWAFYNPFSKVIFLCPIPIENGTLLKKILGCLNIGLILTFPKKLMLRIWQRLLQNWAFCNQFSKVIFLFPIPIENGMPLKKILGCLKIGFILTFLKKIILRIWQRLLHDWAFYNQFSKVIFLCPIPIENCTYMKFFWTASIWIYMKKKVDF